MYRLVAIFFLLWTLTDLSVPQLCLADFDAPATLAGASKDQTDLHASSQPNGNGPANIPFQQDDDCFCCCSHVLPSSFVRDEKTAICILAREGRPGPRAIPADK